jgi:lipid A 4'-phosphatase
MRRSGEDRTIDLNQWLNPIDNWAVQWHHPCVSVTVLSCGADFLACHCTAFASGRLESLPHESIPTFSSVTEWLRISYDFRFALEPPMEPQMFWERPRTRGIFVICALLLIGVACTVVLDAINADPNWAQHFYSPGGTHGGWTHTRDFPWGLLYDYGELLGLGLTAAVVLLFIASMMGKVSRKYAKPCLVVILTVVIGPGILVNGIFKNYWGRPRPVEIVQFGGEWEYRKVWEPGIPGKGKSFPCGHCAMAFSVASGAAFFPIHPVAAAGALVGGVAYGIVMGVARMAQGGHFPTDVLWSGVLVLSLIAGLYYLVFRIPERSDESQRLCDLRGATKVSLLAAFVVFPAMLCLFHWPVYSETRFFFKEPPGIKGILLHASPDWVKHSRDFTPGSDRVELRTVSSGFGFPWARFRDAAHTTADGDTMVVEYEVSTRGLLSEPHCDATLFIPLRK